MKLYGKDKLKSGLDGIAAKGRLPHAIMFSGQSGSGRKTLAKYAAELFLCQSSPRACGECAVCRNIENDAHPDVIFVKKACEKKSSEKKSGEKKTGEGSYSKQPFREILRDTVVRPNDGEFKIYVFEDCDTMRPELNQALLKLIEEPAEYLRFIFTCENTGIVPETIMSRVMEFEVPSTPVKDCEQALVDSGVDKKQARELAEMIAGNIGDCRAALEGGSEAELIETAKKAAAALGKRDGYALAATLLEKTNRAEFSRVMEHLMRILRDALALKLGGSAEFGALAEAKKIAAAFSEEEILNALDARVELAKNEIYNLNLQLTVAYFVSRALKG